MSHRQVNLSELRERAEAAIEHSQSGLIDAPGSPEESKIHHLVEELRIYQTELEIQNQELVSAQSEISLALEKYRALFENLPLPGIIVDGQGFIVEANLQACAFFGLSQHVALHRRSVLQLFEFDSRNEVIKVIGDRKSMSPQSINRVRLQNLSLIHI